MSHGLHLDLNTAIQIAALAAAGPAGAGLSEVAKHALFQMASRSLSGSASQLGLSGHEASLLRALASGAHLSPNDNSQLSDALLNAAYRHGGLAQSEQQLTDAITKLTTALGQKGLRDATNGSDGSSGGESWLEAIAKAMGQALGNMAARLVSESQALNQAAGDSSTGGAQHFQSLMTQFQAHSQLFGMLSDAFSNAVKSIGEGMKSMASKT